MRFLPTFSIFLATFLHCYVVIMEVTTLATYLDNASSRKANLQNLLSTIENNLAHVGHFTLESKIRTGQQQQLSGIGSYSLDHMVFPPMFVANAVILLSDSSNQRRALLQAPPRCRFGDRELRKLSAVSKFYK